MGIEGNIKPHRNLQEISVGETICMYIYIYTHTHHENSINIFGEKIMFSPFATAEYKVKFSISPSTKGFEDLFESLYGGF